MKNVILVRRRGAKPEIVEVERMTPAGKVKISEFKKLFKKEIGDIYDYLGGSFVRPYLMVNTPENLKVAEKLHQEDLDRKAKILAEKQEREDKRLDEISQMKENHADYLKALRESKIQHNEDDIYQAIAPNGNYVIFKISPSARLFTDDPEFEGYATYLSQGSFSSMSGVYFKTYEEVFLELARQFC